MIQTRRFKYEQIIPLILELENNERFQVEIVGHSFENREIYQVQWGMGPTKVLMWAQMHGDESTASRAILDIWKFLMAQDDEFDELREDLFQKISIHFVPILNPDGANQWQRRTLQDIDMNRDALRLQTPEARILKSLCTDIKPLFGFNLHDQSIYYSAGTQDKPATISFLAPAYNEAKEINEVRKRSMQLIGLMNRELQAYLPNQIGKYDDTFNARAFGDNIQKWGISTILIESGGYKSDPEKEQIRKINFALILDALNLIASEKYREVDLKQYESIPFNSKDHFFDLVLRNGILKRNGTEYKVDLAINREEVDYNSHKDFYYKSKIVEVGDLSTFYGYEEIDLDGMEIEPGRVYPHNFKTYEEASSFNLNQVLSNGYTSVVIDDTSLSEQFSTLPVNLLPANSNMDHQIGIDEPANLVVLEGDQVKLTIVNGFVYEPKSNQLGIRNALVFQD